MTWRRVFPALLAGVVIGAMFLTPAVAHINQNAAHIGRHVWRAFIKDVADRRYVSPREGDRRYLNTGEKAADAETVDGLDSSELARRPVSATRWWSCAGAAFTPENESAPYFVHFHGYLRLGGADIPGGVTTFYCTMSLPDGAVVTGMRATFRWKDDRAFGRCFLEEVELLGTAEMAESNLGAGSGFYATTNEAVGPRASGQPVTAQRTVYPTATIDNQRYAYHVECDFSESASGTLSADTLGLYGVAVQYRVPTVPGT